MKQLNCKGMVACEKTVVNKETNLLSLNDIVFQMFLTVGPHELSSLGSEARGTGKPMELVVFWEREKEYVGDIELDFTVDFIDPTGVVLIEDMKSQVKMVDGLHKFYSVIQLPRGIMCMRPGLHSFRITSGDESKTDAKVVCEDSFKIVMLDPEGKTLSI